MSGSAKVQFKESAKAKGKMDIPTQDSPDAVILAAGPDGVARTQEDFNKLPIRDRTATDEQFPTAGLNRSEKMDVIMSEKLQTQDPEHPGVTSFGKLIAKDSDFAWLARKREAEAEANFQQWFAANFDKMSPEQKKLAAELWPDFYQQRLALLDKDINLMRRIARSNVTGIQNREDMLLAYAKEAGFIDTNRLANLMHPEAAAYAQDLEQQKNRFRRGLLNPRRLPRGVALGIDRAGSSMLTMNRETPSPAAAFGIGADGFNVQDIATPVEEGYTAWPGLLANVK